MNHFLCGYCGSPHLQMREGEEVLLELDKHAVWLGGNNPNVFRYLIHPKIICDSCGQQQQHIEIWSNKLGIAIFKLGE